MTRALIALASFLFFAQSARAQETLPPAPLGEEFEYDEYQSAPTDPLSEEAPEAMPAPKPRANSPKLKENQDSGLDLMTESALVGLGACTFGCLGTAGAALLVDYLAERKTDGKRVVSTMLIGYGAGLVTGLIFIGSLGSYVALSNGEIGPEIFFILPLSGLSVVGQTLGASLAWYFSDPNASPKDDRAKAFRFRLPQSQRHVMAF